MAKPKKQYRYFTRRGKGEAQRTRRKQHEWLKFEVKILELSTIAANAARSNNKNNFVGW